MGNLELILNQNKEVLEKWLHEISSLSIPFLNSSGGRFLKTRLNLDILEKLINTYGWINSKNIKNFSLEESGIQDNVSEHAGYNLLIETNKILIKSQDCCILNQKIILQRTRSTGSTNDLKDNEYDYIMVYNPVFSNKRDGHIGILLADNIKDYSEKNSYCWTLKLPKNTTEYSYFLTVKEKYKVESMGEDEIARLFKLFRNRVCDSISSFSN